MVDWQIPTPFWADRGDDGSWVVIRRTGLYADSFGWFCTKPLACERYNTQDLGYDLRRSTKRWTGP